MSRLACALVCLFAVPPAQAAGVNLRWDRCLGDGGVAIKNFACDTNEGDVQVLASFVLPAPQEGVTRVLATLNLAVASSTIPPWWNVINPGSCRPTAVGVAAGPASTPGVCPTWSGSNGFAFFIYTIGTLGANTATLSFQVAVPSAGARNLAANQEYFDASVFVLFDHTVDAGFCAGCSVPACLALRSIEVGNPTAIVLTQPTNGTDSNYVTWQGGAGTPSLPGGACPAATSARTRTWGSLKSLYR
jgi:hypothetical protein